MHLKSEDLKRSADRIKATSNSLYMIAEAFELAQTRLEKLRVALNNIRVVEELSPDIEDIVNELNSDWREEQDELEQKMRAANNY